MTDKKFNNKVCRVKDTQDIDIKSEKISKRNKKWWTFWFEGEFVDNGNEVLII